MLSVDEARARILDKITIGPAEWLSLPNAGNRVLATALDASRDQPPVALSAMDGYAVRAVDTVEGGWLTLVGEVAAGHAGNQSIAPGEAVRIFTGGVIPDGADAILIQENAQRRGDQVRPNLGVAEGTYVRPAGLDFKAGRIYIPAGTRLDARHLGLAASLGHAWINVRHRPKIGIFATGDELVWPGAALNVDQVASSNTACLSGLVQAWGGDPVDLGIVRDEKAALEHIITQLDGLDMIVSTGGASVGDHDLVREVFGNAGLLLDFWKIAMRPGKPLIFGELEQTPLLGLPGNPVSAAVCAIVFLRAAIRKRLGLPFELPINSIRVGSDLPENGEREHYMRALLERDDQGRQTIRTVENQDSSMFATFAQAQALLVRPRHDPAKQAGDLVSAIELDRVINR